MLKTNDPRLKDSSYQRHNSMILDIIDKNTLKKPAVPLNPKASSRLSQSKSGACDKKSFKKIKSLSPVEKEELLVPYNKENKPLCSSFLKKLPDSNNSQEQDSSSEIEKSEFLKNLRKKVESIDKKFSFSSNSRIREYFDVFDEFTHFFHDFKFFLSKFKRLFEQVYLKNILLMNELEEVKESIKKSQDWNELDKSIDELDEGSLRKVSSDVNINRIPVFFKKDNRLGGRSRCKLGSDSELSIIQEKPKLEQIKLCEKSSTKEKPRRLSFNETLTKVTEKSSSKERIPKLSFNENTISVQGFQDEFMQNFDNFSTSWRKMIQDQKRFD